MVNGLSASASEFLAAAIQDYNRGIVVGSRTYGKATGQEVFALEPDNSPTAKKQGYGYTIITTLKIYRVTGKTAQKRGVSPDIVLPDLYDFIKFREEFMTGALPSDSISKKIYYTPLRVLPICELRQKSAVRVSNNAGFQTTINCSKVLGGLKSKLDTLPMNYGDYKRFITNEIKQFELLKETTDNPTAVFKIGNHLSDRERIQGDEYTRQANDAWTKKLMRDISLEEAFFILCDYINGPNGK
jgi:carboxyl-terminal processing protease